MLKHVLVRGIYIQSRRYFNGFPYYAASLATVTNYAVPKMTEGGSIVTLSFEAQRPFPYYNWMGVNKVMF